MTLETKSWALRAIARILPHVTSSGRLHSLASLDGFSRPTSAARARRLEGRRRPVAARALAEVEPEAWKIAPRY